MYDWSMHVCLYVPGSPPCTRIWPLTAQACKGKSLETRYLYMPSGGIEHVQLGFKCLACGHMSTVTHYIIFTEELNVVNDVIWQCSYYDFFSDLFWRWVWFCGPYWGSGRLRLLSRAVTCMYTKAELSNNGQCERVDDYIQYVITMVFGTRLTTQQYSTNNSRF